MIKRNSLLIIFLLLAGIMKAEVDRIMIIETSEGMKISFALSDSPELLFDGRTLKVTSNNDSHSFELSNITKWYFESLTTNINDVIKNEMPIVEYNNNENIIVNGITFSSKIRLHSIDGKERMVKVSFTGDKKAIISIASLPQGLYILSLGKQQSIKIFKK